MHMILHFFVSLRWRHNGRDGVSNHQPHDCLLNRLFRRRSKKTSKLRITGLCAGNSPVTSEFPAQMASNAENVSISWCHHVLFIWAVLRWCAKVINSHSATRFHVIYDTVLLCFVYMSSSQLILQSYLRGDHEAITHYWPLYQDTQ